VQSINLSVSDYPQLGKLESRLRTVREATVTRVAGKPALGELGAEDVLLIAFAGISALADIIELARAYSRSRDTGIGISATSSGKRHTKTIELRNATDEQVEEFLDWFKGE
jgi:hypothetical protein